MSVPFNHSELNVLFVFLSMFELLHNTKSIKMSCSISEHSFYKTIPTKLLKLVLMSKSINKLQNRASIYQIFLPSAHPDHIKDIYPYFTHIFPSFHTQATIKRDLYLSPKF